MTPASKAAALLATADHPFADQAAQAVLDPCWAGMFAFIEPIAGPDVLRPAAGPIAWLARETSRPLCPPGPDAWVVHASPDWTRANLDRSANDVAQDLLTAFRDLTGSNEPALQMAAHRWRYAQVATPLGTPCLWDAAAHLGVCGDWCIGPRIEAAWESGIALGAALGAAS